MAQRILELQLGGEHGVYVLFTALAAIREEFIYRSASPTEVTRAPYLQWVAAAEDSRLQVKGQMLTHETYFRHPDPDGYG